MEDKIWFKEKKKKVNIVIFVLNKMLLSTRMTWYNTEWNSLLNYLTQRYLILLLMLFVRERSNCMCGMDFSFEGVWWMEMNEAGKL